MPLAQENINAFIASFISILGAECNDYLEALEAVEPDSLTEKQRELCAALRDIVAGKTQENSPALQKIQFSTNFYITALCLLDPKNAFPLSRIDLTQADQNQLIAEYRKKVEWYISRLDADHGSQQTEQSQPVIAQSSTPPPAVRPPQAGTQLHDDPIMQDKTTYKSWFAYLGKEQSVILQRTYDKLLAAKNPQLIQLIKFVDEQIKMTGWNANEKKHAYLYYYHYATLTLSAPNKKINLNQKLIELEEKRAQFKHSVQPIQAHRNGPRDPILAELREIRSELRQQRLAMELNRFMWQVFLYDLYHQKDGEKHKTKD